MASIAGDHLRVCQRTFGTAESCDTNSVFSNDVSVYVGKRGLMITSQRKRAVFASGCFWGMQDLIRKLAGVVNTRVGYTGGDVPNATYRNHGSHAEAIEIESDPTRITCRDLLEFFFPVHDPTTLNRQGHDVRTSYRSEAFYVSEALCLSKSPSPRCRPPC